MGTGFKLTVPWIKKRKILSMASSVYKDFNDWVFWDNWLNLQIWKNILLNWPINGVIIPKANHTSNNGMAKQKFKDHFHWLIFPQVCVLDNLLPLMHWSERCLLMFTRDSEKKINQSIKKINQSSIMNLSHFYATIHS